MALIGLIGYVAIMVSLLAPEREETRFADDGPDDIGFGFSAYLTYRELFSIHEVCEGCVSSAVIMTILLCLAPGVSCEARSRTSRGSRSGPLVAARVEREPAGQLESAQRRARRRSRALRSLRVPDRRECRSRASARSLQSPPALRPMSGRNHCRGTHEECAREAEQNRARPFRRHTADGREVRSMCPDSDSPDSAARPDADARSAEQVARLFEMTSDLLATISTDGRFQL